LTSIFGTEKHLDILNFGHDLYIPQRKDSEPTVNIPLRPKSKEFGEKISTTLKGSAISPNIEKKECPNISSAFFENSDLL
jgi:hypothetical protein